MDCVSGKVTEFIDGISISNLSISSDDEFGSRVFGNLTIDGMYGRFVLSSVDIELFIRSITAGSDSICSSETINWIEDTSCNVFVKNKLGLPIEIIILNGDTQLFHRHVPVALLRHKISNVLSVIKNI